LQIYLLDGHPAGRVKAFMRGWTGAVWRIPKELCARCGGQSDFAGAGVLCLLDGAQSRTLPTESLYAALMEQEPSAWQNALAFTCAEGFSAEERAYLCARLSGKVPTCTLPDEGESALEEYIEKAQLCADMLASNEESGVRREVFADTQLEIPATSRAPLTPVSSTLSPQIAPTDILTPQPSPLNPHSRTPQTLKPSSAEIAAQIEEDPACAAFLGEAQRHLGTFGYPEQASLLWMHNYLGLDWEALLVLLHQVREHETQPGLKSYESYANKLARDGATTAETAEAWFTVYRNVPRLYTFLTTRWNLSGSKPTPAQSEKLERWTAWGFADEVIDLAFEAALDIPAKRPFDYADKVLRVWQSEGIRTPEQVQAARAAWSAKVAQKSTKTAARAPASSPDGIVRKGGQVVPSTPGGWDLDELARRARQKPVLQEWED
jgi:DnaD/phage-associated family protein